MTNEKQEREPAEALVLPDGTKIWVPVGLRMGELEVQAVGDAVKALRGLAKVRHVQFRRDFADSESLHGLFFMMEKGNKALKKGEQ